MKVTDDLACLFGLMSIDVDPGQLIPAERAHWLQLRIALQDLDGLVELAALNQHQPESVPRTIELRAQLDCPPESRLSTFQITPLFKHKPKVEPVVSVARMMCSQVCQQSNRLIAPS